MRKLLRKLFGPRPVKLTGFGPVRDAGRWAGESDAVRNEISWCYAELNRLGSVVDTQDDLISEYCGHINEIEAELRRTVETMRGTRKPGPCQCPNCRAIRGEQ